ncbi:MAG: DNA polymerase III subunit delta [Prolixibacteraceae bacterium]|nr:DNA polymerase III subunit delta [Prolixibacteraceae bacterium]
MDYNIILQNLKKKIYHPVYLLQGNEPYFIDQISDYIEKNVLSEEEKHFNLTIFYGKDTDISTVVESALRFPMMAARQVVIVKEAQDLKKYELLKNYSGKPMPTTILVLNYKYGMLKGNQDIIKNIEKNGVVLTTKKIYENKMPVWIENYLAGKNITITPQASQIITAFLGNDLGKVANELDKLIIATEGNKKITPEDIEKNIGLSKDFNIIELQNALGERDIFKANRIINYFGANQSLHPVQVTIASLFYYFSKLFSYHFMKDKSEKGFAGMYRMHPYIAKLHIQAARKYSPTKLYEIMGILREYDLKSKGLDVSTMVESSELQKEMIYKILH